MSGLLENKVCIITGASRGIGKETAELFASEGATVIVCLLYTSDAADD